MPEFTYQTPDPFSKLPLFLTATEVCEIFGISKPTLLSAVKNGQFPKPVRFGEKCWRFSKPHVLAFIQKQAGGIQNG